MILKKPCNLLTHPVSLKCKATCPRRARADARLELTPSAHFSLQTGPSRLLDRMLTHPLRGALLSLGLQGSIRGEQALFRTEVENQLPSDFLNVTKSSLPMFSLHVPKWRGPRQTDVQRQTC